MTDDKKTPIQLAIEQVGPSALADAIGVTPQFVTSLAKGLRPVPPGRCLAIERATGGKVTRYELRPDIYGDPNEQPKRAVGER